MHQSIEARTARREGVRLMKLVHSWWFFAAGTLLAGILLLRLPTPPIWNLDLTSYQETVYRMRDGRDYYLAMTQGLAAQGVGPVSKLYAYRLPTVFWLWRVCCFSWPATFIVVVVIGILVGLATMPIIGLMTIWWLGAALHAFGVEQWGFVEIWAVPFAVASVLAIRKERWVLAALMALSAALVREQALLLILGGLLAALVYKRFLWPWLTALAAWTLFLAWHFSQARPYLVADGREPPLLGGGRLGMMAEMAGPYTFGAGLVIVVFAVWKARWTPAWWLAAPLIVAIPLAGLFTFRFHWGFLVLPVALSLAGSLFPPAHEAMGRGLEGATKGTPDDL
jgi:hypothetical protein